MILKELGEFAFRFHRTLRLILDESVPMRLIEMEKERQEIKQIFVRCQSTVVRKLLGTEDFVAVPVLAYVSVWLCCPP